MDLLTIVKLALFVPFFLVLAIFAIVYLIAGYKKDLGRSIISLSSTIVATGISLILAKLISFALSGPIFSALSSAMGESATQLRALGDGFIKGIVEIVLSFVLFVLFFIITLAVFKSVSKKINWGKLESLNKNNKGTRLAGMGIRAIDAILVSVMLLLPLYGTVAMVAPPAATLMRMSLRGDGADSVMQVSNEHKNDLALSVQFAAVSVRPAASVGMGTQEADVSEILDVMANHPVLVPYKYGPGAWVYSGLSTFSMNGKQVDIATAAESLEGLLDRFEVFIDAIETENEEKIFSATESLIDFARKKVVNQRWSYDMVMAFVGEIDGLLEQYSDDIDAEFTKTYDMLRPLFDMTFEEYKHNAEGLLEFASWGLDKYDDLAKLAKAEDFSDFTEADALNFMSELMNEVYARIGKLINHSKQAVGLKRFALQMYAEMRLFDTVPSSYTATSFIDKYYGDGFVDEEKREAEALAIITLLDAHQPLDVAAAFACHPLFGADAIIETFGNDLYVYGLGHLGTQLKTSEKAEEAYEKLNGMLRAFKGNSMIVFTRFSDAAERLLIDEIGLDYGYNDYGGSFTAGTDEKGNYIVDSEGNHYYFSSFEDENGIYITPDTNSAGNSFTVKIEK